MEFEWDSAKRASNLAKHGIDFADAVEAFEAPMLVAVDSRADYGETRFAGIGRAAGRVIVVVWTEREDVIRLISARRANAKERTRYETPE